VLTLYACESIELDLQNKSWIKSRETLNVSCYISDYISDVSDISDLFSAVNIFNSF